jgi:tRNA U54 and U55 pseudouridine synthase Pus10
MQAEETKFVGSGREDLDVRMLGEGRPFFLEFLNRCPTYNII